MEENWNDYDFVMEKVQNDPWKLVLASDELKNNKEIVLAAVKVDGEVLCCASDELKNNKEIIIEAIRNNAAAWSDVGNKLRNNRKFIKEAIKENFVVLRWIDYKMRTNKRFLGQLLEENKESLDHVQEIMRWLYGKEKQKFLKRLKNKKFFKDDKFIMNLVKAEGCALMFVDSKFRNDPNIVTEAVKQDAFALAYASEELRNNRDIVMTAVKQNGLALTYASEDLRNNRDIVMTAVKQNGFALTYATEEVCDNPDIVVEAIKQEPRIIDILNPNMLNNEKVKYAIQERIMDYQLKSKVSHIYPLIIKREKVANNNQAEFEKISEYLKSEIRGIEDAKEAIRQKKNIARLDDKNIEDNLEERIQYYKEAYENKNWKNDFRLCKMPNVEKVTIDDIQLYENEPNKPDFCLNIKDVSELSISYLEELEKEYNIVSIQLSDNNIKGHAAEMAYDPLTYKQCRSKIDELIADINLQDDEYQKFSIIMKRLANSIEYDHELLRYGQLHPENQFKEEFTTTLRNLEGGLLRNACVCAGYAEIVRNVLPCIGIEARYVAGMRDKGNYLETGHVWNQVKLNGNWYNIDLTWDRDNIVKGERTRYMLKSDEEFGHQQYMLVEGLIIDTVVSSLPEEQVDALFSKKENLGQDNLIKQIEADVKMSDIKNVQEILVATDENKNRSLEQMEEEMERE